jgi:hypothetical protein
MVIAGWVKCTLLKHMKEEASMHPHMDIMTESMVMTMEPLIVIMSINNKYWFL